MDKYLGTAILSLKNKEFPIALELTIKQYLFLETFRDK